MVTVEACHGRPRVPGQGERAPYAPKPNFQTEGSAPAPPPGSDRPAPAPRPPLPPGLLLACPAACRDRPRLNKGASPALRTVAGSPAGLAPPSRSRRMPPSPEGRPGPELPDGNCYPQDGQRFPPPYERRSPVNAATVLPCQVVTILPFPHGRLRGPASVQPPSLPPGSGPSFGPAPFPSCRFPPSGLGLPPGPCLSWPGTTPGASAAGPLFMRIDLHGDLPPPTSWKTGRAPCEGSPPRSSCTGGVHQDVPLGRAPPLNMDEVGVDKALAG
jgi:hypothetical protein